MPLVKVTEHFKTKYIDANYNKSKNSSATDYSITVGSLTVNGSFGLSEESYLK